MTSTRSWWTRDPLPSEIEDLAGLVREAEPEALTLFFTHAHWDHVLGRPWWPEAKTARPRSAGWPPGARRAAGILTDIEALAIEHGEHWTHGFDAVHAQSRRERAQVPCRSGRGGWCCAMRPGTARASSPVTSPIIRC